MALEQFMDQQPNQPGMEQTDLIEHKRRRRRRRTRRAYIRSIHLLPSMATLGNAICGFAAIYIAGWSYDAPDPWTQALLRAATPYEWAAYLIFIAMIFDGLDGRLARFTRHTTDFGGQLDSMADVVSFGIAPAILMLQYARVTVQALPDMPFVVTRTIWAIGAVYASCAAIRLARFNVSNQHGEQHHFSFLGMPSPGAAGVVAAMVLMDEAAFCRYREMYNNVEYGWQLTTIKWIGYTVSYAIPVMTLLAGLLMVSTIRYPHIVNRFLKGKKSVGRLVIMLIIGGVTLALYKYALAIAMLIYIFWGLGGAVMSRFRRRSAGPASAAASPTPSA
jgi:CDP-diacylglycerol---serine O-phosphatidyltransferase